jgi:serine/threonine-protein kinase
MNWTELRQSLLGNVPKATLPPELKLPVLPMAVIEFSRKADNPDVGAMELAKVIESDAGLTCELLRHVNSAAVGLRTKVAGAKQALSVLGIRNVKLLLISSGVERALKASQSKLINFQVFSAGNLERALFARELARRTGADCELAFAASMLTDFLLPALGNELLYPYLDFIEMADAARPPLVQYERKRFGWDHAQAMGQIMQSWNFPDDLVCAVLLHHAGLALIKHPQMKATSCAVVACAALIPDPLKQSPHGLKQLLELESLLPGFSLIETAKTVQKAFSELGQGLNNPFPLARRIEKLMASPCEAGYPQTV